MFFAVLFYVGVGALVFALLYEKFSKNEQNASQKQVPSSTGQHDRAINPTTLSPTPTCKKPRYAVVVIAGAFAGLLVVLALAWAGGKWGNGNDWFPSSGNISPNFTSPTYSTLRSDDVYVNGYYRGNGTYVASHMSSQDDGVFENNWSTKGNPNPYTGNPATRVTPPRRD